MFPKQPQKQAASPIVSVSSTGFPAVPSEPATKVGDGVVKGLQPQLRGNAGQRQQQQLPSPRNLSRWLDAEISAVLEEPLTPEMLRILGGLRQGFDELERRLERLEIKHMEEEVAGWSRHGGSHPQGTNRGCRNIVASGIGAAQRRMEGTGLPHDGPCLPGGEAIARNVADGCVQEERPSKMARGRSGESQYEQRRRWNVPRPPQEPALNEMGAMLQVRSPETTVVRSECSHKGVRF